MRILYQCEICGHTSESEPSIVACEGKGRPTFKQGDTISFYDEGHGSDISTGVVTGVLVQKCTHRVEYAVKTFRSNITRAVMATMVIDDREAGDDGL